MSKVLKTGRTMTMIYAETNEPKIPTREECSDLSDMEFAEWKTACEIEHADWVKAQEEAANLDMGDEADETNGPGAAGWVNPDSISGPGVK